MATDPRTMTQAQARATEIDVGLRRYMLRIYNYMAMGLAVSGMVAMIMAYTSIGEIFFMRGITPTGHVGIAPTGFGWVAIWAPLGILLLAMFKSRSMSFATLQSMYWLFVAVNGISLSLLLMVYTGESVVQVFFITSAAFAGLSLFGYTTKKDLSGFGSFLIMGVWGLLIVGIVNMFMQSAMMHFVFSAAGVLIFAGLAAYKTQELKLAYSERLGDEAEGRLAIFGAWMLYITFINLLQFLMYFLGNRQ